VGHVECPTAAAVAARDSSSGGNNGTFFPRSSNCNGHREQRNAVAAAPLPAPSPDGERIVTISSDTYDDVVLDKQFFFFFHARDAIRLATIANWHEYLILLIIEDFLSCRINFL
jgi:hypothetical protein